jgi:hypothetical protein
LRNNGIPKLEVQSSGNNKTRKTKEKTEMDDRIFRFFDMANWLGWRLKLSELSVVGGG